MRNMRVKTGSWRSRFGVTAAAGVLSLGLASGCTPGGGPLVPEANVGQFNLPSLSDVCEGHPGLTGQALLDLKQERLEGTLSYVTAQGQSVDPTSLTVELSWPSNPVATCYPAHSTDGGLSAEARLAIPGVSMLFTTADGKFAETLTAKAWLTTFNGNHTPSVFAVTTRPQLAGAWVPFPEYDGPSAQTLLFNVSLNVNDGQAGGLVGLSDEDPALLNAAILRSRFAVALFQ